MTARLRFTARAAAGAPSIRLRLKLLHHNVARWNPTLGLSTTAELRLATGLSKHRKEQQWCTECFRYSWRLLSAVQGLLVKRRDLVPSSVTDNNQTLSAQRNI